MGGQKLGQYDETKHMIHKHPIGMKIRNDSSSTKRSHQMVSKTLDYGTQMTVRHEETKTWQSPPIPKFQIKRNTKDLTKSQRSVRLHRRGRFGRLRGSHTHIPPALSVTPSPEPSHETNEKVLEPKPPDNKKEAKSKLVE